MVMLDSARRGARVPALARWLLGLGIAATLAANVAHGLGHGPLGAAVGAWPALALVGSYELLMMIIRGTQSPEAAAGAAGAGPAPRPEPRPALCPGCGSVRRPHRGGYRPVDPCHPGHAACGTATRTAGPRAPRNGC